MNDHIAENELDEIERRTSAATLGPWKAFVEGRDHTSGSNFIRTGGRNSRGPDLELTGGTVADIDFVANARQDLPKLVAEVRRLQRLLAGSTQ